MSLITTIAELEALYGAPVEEATVKEVDRITPHYRAYIEASRFAILILAALSDTRGGSEVYDREWPGRAAKAMW